MNFYPRVVIEASEEYERDRIYIFVRKSMSIDVYVYIRKYEYVCRK